MINLSKPMIYTAETVLREDKGVEKLQKRSSWNSLHDGIGPLSCPDTEMTQVCVH